MVSDPKSLGLLTADELDSRIERIIYDSDDQIDAVDAFLEACNELGIDVETASTIVSTNTKAALEDAFEKRKMLPKRAKLPIDW
jgi:hypothetical protein